MNDKFYKSESGDLYAGKWDGLKHFCVICLAKGNDIPTIKSAIFVPYGIIWNEVSREAFEMAFKVAQAGQRECFYQVTEVPEVSPIESLKS